MKISAGLLIISLASVFAIAQNQHVGRALKFSVLVLNDKTGQPEKDWVVTVGNPKTGLERTDKLGTATISWNADNPPHELYVSEWSHKNCANRTFEVSQILKSGVVADGTCDRHLVIPPYPTPGVLVLFARSLSLGEKIEHWWAAKIYPGP